jgi:hypothetical protein
MKLDRRQHRQGKRKRKMRRKYISSVRRGLTSSYLCPAKIIGSTPEEHTQS